MILCHPAPCMINQVVFQILWLLYCVSLSLFSPVLPSNVLMNLFFPYPVSYFFTDTLHWSLSIMFCQYLMLTRKVAQLYENLSGNTNQSIYVPRALKGSCFGPLTHILMPLSSFKRNFLITQLGCLNITQMTPILMI